MRQTILNCLQMLKMKKCDISNFQYKRFLLREAMGGLLSLWQDFSINPAPQIFTLCPKEIIRFGVRQAWINKPWFFLYKTPVDDLALALSCTIHTALAYCHITDLFIFPSRIFPFVCERREMLRTLQCKEIRVDRGTED